MTLRKGHINDLYALKKLALNSWAEFKDEITQDNWNTLSKTINSDNTYIELLNIAECIVYENNAKEIIGMIYLVPKGNPTEIYDEKWSYIRFLSVNSNYRGKGIGKLLTKKCIEIAKQNNEETIALHTSEVMKSARHIYEKIGFKILKKIKPRLGIKYWLYVLEL